LKKAEGRNDRAKKKFVDDSLQEKWLEMSTKQKKRFISEGIK